MQRVGDAKAIAYASLLNLPFILILILPALNTGHDVSGNFFYSLPFVTAITVCTSFLNGFG